MKPSICPLFAAPARKPLLLLAIVTTLTFSFTIYMFLSGWMTIYQNLLYFPIIIACVFFDKKGFLFSLILSLGYLALVFSLSRDPEVLEGAVIRVVIFLSVALVITCLSVLRNQTVEQLNEREQHLSEAQSIGHIGSWTYEIPEKRLIWTSEVFRIFNRDPALSEPDSNALTTMYHPDDRESFSSAIQALIIEGISFDHDWRLSLPSGEEKFVHVRGEPVISEGRIVRIRGVIQDISERKTTESELIRKNEELFAAYEQIAATEEELRANYEELQGKQRELAISEERLRLKLESFLSPDYDIGEEDFANIIDSQEIQKLMDDFYALTKIGIAIVDMKGTILVATGWQDICTKFHRVHPDTQKNCVESDLFLGNSLKPGEFRAYKCKNHLWDIVTPIMIGDRHMGNLFLGQFFYEDEVPEYDVFREQAERYEFDVDEYMAALDRVPRWSHETVERVFNFYVRFAAMISRLSYSNLKLAKALLDNSAILSELRLSEAKYRTYIEFSPMGILVTDERGTIQESNEAACTMLGFSHDNLVGLHVEEIMDDSMVSKGSLSYQKLVSEGYVNLEIVLKTKDGDQVPAYVSAVKLPDESYIAFVLDVSELKRAQKAQALAMKRIEENVVQMAMLNDQIRNPLTVISTICEMEEIPQSEAIQKQVSAIDNLVREIDRGSVDSLKIREYLKKHYNIGYEEL